MPVHQTFTGDAGQLNSELDRVNRKYAQMEAQLRDLQRQSNRTNQDAAGGLAGQDTMAQRALSSLMALGAQYVTVTGAVAALNQELERRAQLEQEARTQQLTVAEAQETLAINVGRAGFEPRVQAARQILDQLERGGEADVISGFVTTASTAGQLGIAGEREALATAMQISPSDPQRAATIAGATLQVQNVLGPEADAATALGLISTAGGQAAITSPQQVAARLSPLIATAAEIDPQAGLRGSREAAALFATLTQVTGPAGAERAGTASIGVMQALANFFADPSREDPGGLFARLGAMQQDPAMQAEFAPIGRNIPGVAADLQASVRGLISDPEGRMATEIRNRFQMIRADPSYVAEQIELIREGTPEFRLATEERRIEGIRERRRREGGLAIRPQLMDLFESIQEEREGFGGFAYTALENLTFNRLVLRAYSDEFLASRLHAGATQQQAGMLGAARDPSGPGGAEITPAEQRSLDRMSSILETLADILLELRGNARESAANAQADRHQE